MWLLIIITKLSSGFSAFFLAMSLYPDAQRKAQEELDRVCVDRLPDFTDRGSLPFDSAIVNEVLRWGTISPFGACFFSYEWWWRFKAREANADILEKGYRGRRYRMTSIMGIRFLQGRLY